MLKNSLKAFLKIVFITVFAFAFFGCSSKEQSSFNSIMTIGGESVAAEEYSIYLDQTVRSFEKIGGSDIWETDFDGKTAFEAAKENALNSLKMVKLTVLKAKKANVSLSDDEEKQAETDTENYISAYGNENSRETVLNVMREKILYEKMKAQLLSEYTVSINDFESYLAENMDYYKNQLLSISYKAVIADSSQKAEEILHAAENAQSFDEIISEYGAECKIIEETVRLSETDYFDFDAELINEGLLSDVEKTENGYGVYYIEHIIYPADDEIEEAAKADYEKSFKEKIFSNMLSSWEKETEITVNNEIYSSIQKDVDSK